MTRFWFGDSDDWSLSVDSATHFLKLSASTRKYYDAETDGNQHTDLLIGGTTPATEVVGNGLPVRFKGPDGVSEMWESSNNGPRVLVISTDLGDTVADLAEQVADDRTAVADDREATEAAAAALIALSGGANGLALDTDGVPYFDPGTVTGAPTLAVLTDTDGVPYLVGA